MDRTLWKKKVKICNSHEVLMSPLVITIWPLFCYYWTDIWRKTHWSDWHAQPSQIFGFSNWPVVRGCKQGNKSNRGVQTKSIQSLDESISNFLLKSKGRDGLTTKSCCVLLMPLSQSASANFILLPTKYDMCLIHDDMEGWLVHWQRKKLDFEMAKKIPVSAVLSFWSIKGIAIPLLSHAKKFLFLKSSKCIFFKEKWLVSHL